MRKPNPWMYRTPRQPKPKVPDTLRAEVKAKADELIESVLKPAHIKPPPQDDRFNYIVDIYTKWHQSYFYFCAKYCSPGPNVISPFFEVRFARMGYVGQNRFNLSYMRHTGQWREIYDDLSVDECLAAVSNEPHFLP